MGGVIAMRAALDKPALITHLVLTVTSGGLDMAGAGAQDWRTGFAEANPQLPDWFLTFRADLSRDIGRIAQPTLLLWATTTRSARRGRPAAARTAARCAIACRAGRPARSRGRACDDARAARRCASAARVTSRFGFSTNLKPKCSRRTRSPRIPQRQPRLPPSARLVSVSVPPIASASCRAIARPARAARLAVARRLHAPERLEHRVELIVRNAGRGRARRSPRRPARRARRSRPHPRTSARCRRGCRRCGAAPSAA